jgi:hypothetical protein
MPNGHPQVYMKLLINMNVIFTNHFVGTRLAVSKRRMVHYYGKVYFLTKPHINQKFCALPRTRQAVSLRMVRLGKIVQTKRTTNGRPYEMVFLKNGYKHKTQTKFAL